ncbi:hypothetical protein LIER_25613 [Lithospermum erythrorhizon]|uniref:Uncharacterized protein n=1 Tax=Lithospermum erythrorhizon TaxID=34254 RepID=A0AAV3RB99_LITER
MNGDSLSHLEQKGNDTSSSSNNSSHNRSGSTSSPFQVIPFAENSSQSHYSESMNINPSSLGTSSENLALSIIPFPNPTLNYKPSPSPSSSSQTSASDLIPNFILIDQFTTENETSLEPTHSPTPYLDSNCLILQAIIPPTTFAVHLMSLQNGNDSGPSSLEATNVEELLNVDELIEWLGEDSATWVLEMVQLAHIHMCLQQIIDLHLTWATNEFFDDDTLRVVNEPNPTEYKLFELGSLLFEP